MPLYQLAQLLSCSPPESQTLAPGEGWNGAWGERLLGLLSHPDLDPNACVRWSPTSAHREPYPLLVELVLSLFELDDLDERRLLPGPGPYDWTGPVRMVDALLARGADPQLLSMDVFLDRWGPAALRPALLKARGITVDQDNQRLTLLRAACLFSDRGGSGDDPTTVLAALGLDPRSESSPMLMGAPAGVGVALLCDEWLHNIPRSAPAVEVGRFRAVLEAWQPRPRAEQPWWALGWALAAHRALASQDRAPYLDAWAGVAAEWAHRWAGKAIGWERWEQALPGLLAARWGALTCAVAWRVCALIDATAAPSAAAGAAWGQAARRVLLAPAELKDNATLRLENRVHRQPWEAGGAEAVDALEAGPAPGSAVAWGAVLQTLGQPDAPVAPWQTDPWWARFERWLQANRDHHLTVRQHARPDGMSAPARERLNAMLNRARLTHACAPAAGRSVPVARM